MRLYLSKKEAEVLKTTLRSSKTKDADFRARQVAVLERIVLCEQLQENCNRAAANDE